MTAQFGDRVFAILRRVDVVALETRFQLVQEAGIVLEDQQFSGLLAHGLFGRSAPWARHDCNDATKPVLIAVVRSHATL